MTQENRTYYKIYSGDGRIQAMLVQNKENVNIIKPDGTVEIVATMDDVKSKFGGDYIEVHFDEFEATCAELKERANANTESENTATNTEAGSDQATGGSDGESDASTAGDGDGNSEPTKTDGSDSTGNTADAGPDPVEGNADADVSGPTPVVPNTAVGSDTPSE